MCRVLRLAVWMTHELLINKQHQAESCQVEGTTM